MKLMKLYDKILTRVFIWCATRLGYRAISIYVPENTDDALAIHFAADEPSMNTSMRLYVEGLDKPNQNQTKPNQ